MEVVANNYLPGDQHLVDKIVYELKAQGIFDQFRKECFADVDTKPAYQNLRQRVEGSVAGFLKDQSWRPDMNKNQVREMLRKTITESGFLETGVERIVDQVVNPKINTVFLPKVEEIVYSYLGIKKPNRNEPSKSDQCDLLPTDLEAVSPESEPIDKSNDKSSDNFQDLDESKTEEDESPPFEPLEEQSVYVPHEENSVDSHVSGFSGLISHESNHSNENKVTPMGLEQDSQMSRNSSDSRLSIVTSDENSKMDISEDSQSKLVKSGDSNHKLDNDKNKQKTSDKHKSRSESKSDKDRKSSKDSKSRHTSSSSSKDKDKSRDRKDSKSTSSNSNKNDKDKLKDKDRGKNSSSKHSSSKDKTIKKDSSRSDKDKSRSSTSHKDSKPRDKSSDSKSKEKSSSADKYKHSSSHSDRHKKDKDKKKEKSKDDHYSSRDKRTDRRSTDRDSNDGQSSKQNFPSLASENYNSQTQKSSQESTSGGGDSGNSDQTESTTKAPVIITVENTEVTIAPPETQRVKVLKPKCASNIQEALRLRKIRKQLARLEKQNQLSLTSVDLNSPILLSSSINLDDLKEDDKKMQETLNSKIVSELEVVPSPLQNTVISQDNWDAMEAKLREEVCSEFKEFHDDSLDDSTEEQCRVIEEKVAGIKNENKEDGENFKYFDRVDIEQIEFLRFVHQYIKTIERYREQRRGIAYKRKLDHDLKNNNNKQLKIIPDKRAKLTKKNKEKNNYNSEISGANGKFPLPLSPAESDKSKDDAAVIPLRIKRNSITKANSQRYSSDDLYKPRPTFASSRRRGAKNLEN